VTDLLRLLLIVLLVMGNALFVAAEYAIVTARRARLDEQAELGSRRARIALHLMDEPVRVISTVQVGITVFGILLGAIGEPLLSRYFDFLPRSLAFVLSFLILTYLSVVIGELVPKAITLQRSEMMASLLAVPLEAFARLMHPLVWLLQESANGIVRLFGIEPAAAGFVVHTREDIRRTVAEAEDTGVIEEAEEELLYKVFDFADKEVSDVMVPRPQVVALSIELPPEECLEAVMDSPYTRYPVYRGTLDDVVGILHVRSLFTALREHGFADVRLDELVRPAYIVPETKDLAALLAEFRRTNQHIAVVVDEYGSFEGIVTLEDVLEEIVGDIEDEFDLPDESFEQVDESTIRVDGTFPIDDFNERFNTRLPDEDYHTIAGFVFGQLGHAPTHGDEVSWNGLVFRVLEVDGSRINRLSVTFAPTEDAA
jgi:putative hemolysin